MGLGKKGTRKRRSRKLTPEDRKLRRAEEMLRLAQVRVRRGTTTMEYWQAKVQLLNTQKTARIQPSLFETAAPELLDRLLTGPEERETNCRMKALPSEQSFFRAEHRRRGKVMTSEIHTPPTWHTPDSE